MGRISVESELVNGLRLAFNKRCTVAEEGSGIRTFDGHGDGLPGLVIEKFDNTAIAHTYAGIAPDWTNDALKANAAIIVKDLMCSSFYLWRREKKASATTNNGAELLAGSHVSQIVVKEGDLRFICRPEATPSAGLFLDMREVRKNLISTSSGKRVLNTFCFTGALGVAALRGGAKEVVQVDISKSILNWAKDNLALNFDDNLGEIKFICEDTIAFMERERRRISRGKERYDLVIIDPPAFGLSGKVRFVLKDAIDRLVELAINLIKDSGEIIFTVNQSNIGTKEIIDRIKQYGRFKQYLQLKPPEDFTSTEEFASSMRGVWCRVV